MMMHMHRADFASTQQQRKLFVQVDHEAQALDLERSLFVPTRLPWRLGDLLTLALRFPHCEQPLELPVVVVARRPQRSAGVLSAGVMVRLARPDAGLVERLRSISDRRRAHLPAGSSGRRRVGEEFGRRAPVELPGRGAQPQAGEGQ